MPKIKTHSGAKKRIKITKSGLAKKTSANRSHKLIGKSSKQKRRLRETSYVDKSSMEAVKKLLPYK